MNAILNSNLPWSFSSKTDNYDIYDSKGEAIIKVYLRGLSPQKALETKLLTKELVDLVNKSQPTTTEDETPTEVELASGLQGEPKYASNGHTPSLTHRTNTQPIHRGEHHQSYPFGACFVGEHDL